MAVNHLRWWKFLTENTDYTSMVTHFHNSVGELPSDDVREDFVLLAVTRWLERYGIDGLATLPLSVQEYIRATVTHITYF